MMRPCLRKSFFEPAAATSATDGTGAITSRRRSTVPPSMSTQRNIGVETAFCASRSSACVCAALLDVALEQNDAAGVQRRQHQAQARRQGRAVEAHDEQLADLLAKFEAGFGWHGEQKSVTREGVGIQVWREVRRRHARQLWRDRKAYWPSICKTSCRSCDSTIVDNCAPWTALRSHQSKDSCAHPAELLRSNRSFRGSKVSIWREGYALRSAAVIPAASSTAWWDRTKAAGAERRTHHFARS